MVKMSVEKKTPVTPAVSAAPVAKEVQSAGAKKTAPKKEPVKKEAAPKKEVNKKAVAPKKEAGVKKEAVPKKEVGAKKAAPKKTVAKKVEKEGEEEEDASGTRSFKVQLPGDTDYTGRFTGLTPYQAANKALSKYFRCQDIASASSTIEFSIKESTRGSRRNTYNYTGARLKLETPITYTIKSVTGEDRVITKQYKNQLTKIKKNPVEAKEKAAEAKKTADEAKAKPVSA
jgi:hypothetical protein